MATFSFRLPENTKAEAFNIIEAYGLTPSQAFNLFLTEIVKTKTVPVNLSYLKPNADTLEALAEIKSGKAERYNIADNDILGKMQSIATGNL